MKKNVILPISGDLNRGDQALVWETVNIAKEAGFDGEYHILSEDIDDTWQSVKEGLNVASPILKHPSRKFKNKDNNSYGVSLLIKWGAVAIADLIYSLLFLFSSTRKMIFRFSSEETRKTLEIFRDAESFFVKGGGFIHASGKISDPYTIYYSLYHIFLANSLNKPVYIMPNSFGPFKGFGVEWMVRKALNNCEVVTVRESISQDMLEEIKVKSELFPDLGFNLLKSTRILDELENIKENNKNKKLVSITARPYRFPKSDNPELQYTKYIDSMVNFSKWLYDNDYIPVFVEQVLSHTTHESDLTAIKEIAGRLKDDQYLIVSNKSFDCRDIKQIYSIMDYTVGTRFHSVIFSMSENVPSIAIEYGGNKGKGILKDIGLSKYGIPIEEVTFELLKETFKTLINNQEEVKKIIHRHNDIVKTETKELIKILNNQR